MLLANCEDTTNTNITLTAREAAAGDPRVRVVAGDHVGFTRTINRAAAEVRGALGLLTADDEHNATASSLAEHFEEPLECFRATAIADPDHFSGLQVEAFEFKDVVK